ncbi:glycine oxidase [Limimonas halophila]|uniref:Glycine oxidase n=1 Tax=Limimonas halophila TaxID=1082479 RepID=A0A1G7P3I6_9PROT|nr:glycine oxidase ThiO [Limimonas halophila]SDF80791.1 glycine oxidase [Limimonas halophila]
METPFPTAIRHRPHTAVIGGGVNGLGIAWTLARAGCRVDVYDAGEPGTAASWAAAGMLAAGAEAEPGEEALTNLGRLSQRLWPDFAEAVRAASGIDPEYRTDGLLIAAITRDEAERVRWNYQYQREQGIPLDWLTGPQLREREPHLTRHVQGGVASHDDHQVNNRALTRGLRKAAEAAGACVHANTPVEAVVTEGGRATGVRVGGETVSADAVVLAAGAWSHGVAGVPEAARPPVRPVKGQMLSLRMDPEAPLLRHVLWAPTVYLVPRRDGTLVIGGTVEENGFDTTITAGGLYAILQAAWRAVPAIEDLPVQETWVGFRPTSRDDAPILGRSSVDGLWLATGHHRNGILLAPLTAQAVAAEILSGERVPELAPFGPERFTRGRPAAMEAT